MRVAARSEFTNNLKDWKSKFTKPGKIGRSMARNIQHNYLIAVKSCEANGVQAFSE